MVTQQQTVTRLLKENEAKVQLVRAKLVSSYDQLIHELAKH
jgi:hypothetical protein